MSGQTGTKSRDTLWSNPEFLNDITIAVVSIGMKSGALSNDARDTVVQYLADNGFEISWDAIRCVICICFFAVVPLPANKGGRISASYLVPEVAC